MPVSTIDTLMQIAAPPRPAEPAAHASGGTTPFGPALERAYNADRLRQPAKLEDKADEPISANETDYSGGAEEQAEEAPEAVKAPPAGEDAEGTDEETDDEVVISEMASTVVAANEAQQANAAVEEEESLELVVQAATNGGNEGDEALSSTTGSAANDEKGEASAKERRLALTGEEPAAGDASNEDGRSLSTKGARKSKSEKEGSLGTAALPDKGSALAVDEDESKATGGYLKSIPPELLVNDEAESPAEAETNEATGREAAKADGAERINIPPIEQTSELAAAIERHVALMDQSGGAAEAAGAEAAATPPAEATGAGSSTTRAATLDRLTAASMRRNENAAAADGSPTIDRHRFVQRVEGAMKAAQQRDGRVQVRLAPPELGSLRIELSVQNGVMAAKLEAETPAARNALLDNLPALRERLAEQNIRVEKFDVDIRRDSQGSGGNGAEFEGGDRRNEAGSHERRDRSAAPAPPKIAAAKTTRTVTPASDAGLDVRI